MTGRGSHFIESAVDAVTNLKFVLEGFEVDVARAVLNRLEQNQINEANDRRGVSTGFYVGRGAFVFAQAQQIAGVAELLEDFLHARGVGAVVFLDPLLDLISR